jgi:hypothetical protein
MRSMKRAGAKPSIFGGVQTVELGDRPPTDAVSACQKHAHSQHAASSSTRPDCHARSRKSPVALEIHARPAVTDQHHEDDLTERQTAEDVELSSRPFATT